MNKFLILTLLPIFIFSCSGEKSGARISLENYLTHLKNEEFQNAYSYMSNNLKEKCEFNEFENRASSNYEAIKHSRIIYSGERVSIEKVKIEFIIKIDEKEVNLFDLQIMDPYASEEIATFVSESNNWKLDNLIWPVDWCEDIK
tara:strand:+ start:242 stop:673 length:432 start_codon:yes stop_codon:yes gene_type:complete